MTEVVVLGGGPAGLVAATRAGDLGARVTLLTRDALGGMAADDGPVPVRTLAYAARLLRDAGQLGRYGIAVSEPALDYARLLARVREVTGEVRDRAALRRQLQAAGVGDRAVEIVQAATIALAAGMSVDALARLPLSFPTYVGILGRAAAMAARERMRGRVRVPAPA